MPYTPDATDVTQPTDSQKASSMGLEFRTLKAYIQSTIIGLINANNALIGTKAPLNGVGASGTWNISISGLAASAPNATNATNAVNANNSNTTTQRTFSRVRTDGVNRGNYGSISVAGTNTGYSGIDFTDQNVTLMVSDPIQGFYKEATLAWKWYFADGTLTVGAVPWARIPDRPTNLSQFVNDLTTGGVGSFNSRTGAVVLNSSDVSGALGYTPYNGATNPSAFTTLAGVLSAGFQTSSGAVAFASVSGGVNSTNSAGYGIRTISTSAPSGGADGDSWFQV